MLRKNIWVIMLFGVFFAFFTQLVHGDGGAKGSMIFVDSTLQVPSSTDYDVAARTNGGGTAVAYKSIHDALNVAGPGDTVYLRGGTFSLQFRPQTSGEKGAPITIASYAHETVLFTGIDQPALYLINLSNITLDGLTVTDSLGWGRLENCRNIVIRNCTFEDAIARGTTGGMKVVKSAHIKLLDNSFIDGNDNVVIQETDHSLLAGNYFYIGNHSLLSVRCGNYNIIRDNIFNNPDQKAIEIFDCEGVSDAPFKLDATKRNLIEGNLFEYTKGTYRHYYYNGIQYAGQRGIVRRNVFHDNYGGGISIQVYSDEALVNNGHWIYNNTFYDNHCYGISASNVTRQSYFGNIVVNNLLQKNLDCSGNPVQTYIPNANAVRFGENAVLDSDVDPGFVAESLDDFRLRRESPMIDAAAFLVQATEGGSGTVIPVTAVDCFCDGFGIEGERGDLIQFEGAESRARITAIDYEGKTITVDAPLAWTEGHNLALAYNHTAPDMGAYEFQDDDNPQPPPMFRRGDVNGDGKIDLSDPVSILMAVLLQGPPLMCPIAADANDDGKLDLADAISLLGFLFQNEGANPLPAPFPGCGTDPTPDDFMNCAYPADKC